MANDKNKGKTIKIGFNLSWLYLLLFLGIGYLLFRNQRSGEPEKIEWADVQVMAAAGDIAEIDFVRNDFKGEVKMRPDRLAKYADRFQGGIPPRRAPHFYFLVSQSSTPKPLSQP